MSWGDFTCGSCQYDTASDFYKEIVGMKRTIGGKLAKKGITASWTRVRTWGSCQYDTAADFYKEIVGTKRTIGGKLAKKGITASWTRVRTWDEIKKLALKYFEKEYFTNPFWVGPNGCWTQKEVDKKRKKLEASNNVDELFEVCKSQSWDLWTAAPCIAKWAFVGLKLHNVPKPEDVRGPILNQLVQRTNNVTAVYCALLHAYFDVKEDAFSGFDT